jgi:hypothetical protein
MKALGVVGCRIVAIRRLEDAGLEALGWQRTSTALAIELEDGSSLLASADLELNGAGAMVQVRGDDV